MPGDAGCVHQAFAGLWLFEALGVALAVAAHHRVVSGFTKELVTLADFAIIDIGFANGNRVTLVHILAFAISDCAEGC